MISLVTDFLHQFTSRVSNRLLTLPSRWCWLRLRPRSFTSCSIVIIGIARGGICGFDPFILFLFLRSINLAFLWLLIDDIIFLFESSDNLFHLWRLVYFCISLVGINARYNVPRPLDNGLFTLSHSWRICGFFFLCGSDFTNCDLPSGLGLLPQTFTSLLIVVIRPGTGLIYSFNPSCWKGGLG